MRASWHEVHAILKPRNVKIYEHSILSIIEQKYTSWDIENSAFIDIRWRCLKTFITKDNFANN